MVDRPSGGQAGRPKDHQQEPVRAGGGRVFDGAVGRRPVHGPRAIRTRRYDVRGDGRRQKRKPTSHRRRRAPASGFRLHGPVRVRAPPTVADGARRRDVRDRDARQGDAAPGCRGRRILTGRF